MSFALAFVASVGPVAAMAGSKPPETTTTLNVLADPGPRPPINDADYAPYRKSGPAAISGHVSLSLPNARQASCLGQSVILYPNTPFTRWLLAVYARKLDGHRMKDGLLFPGDSGTNVAVPSYLDPFDRDALPTSALRFGACDMSNDIVIRDIPKGDYILMTYIQNETDGIQDKTTQVMVNTPYGEHPEDGSAGSILTRKLGDGYLLATRLELKVDSASSFTLADGNLRAVAHFIP